MPRIAWLRPNLWIAAAGILLLAGCTSPTEYIENGFKVGPNLGVPAGNTAPHWIDAADIRVREDCAEVGRWWNVFQDPVLDRLIDDASRQNLSLREASFRVLESRAELLMTAGNIFPQTQNASGGYQRGAASVTSNGVPGLENQFFDQWAFGFNLSWELDLWGRLRRAIAAADANLDASCTTTTTSS